MVDMYCRLVKAGLRTIKKVPDQYRDAVMADLTGSSLESSCKSIPTTNMSNLIEHR